MFPHAHGLQVDGKIKGFQKELAARPADGLKAELADLRQEQLAFQNDCEEKMNAARRMRFLAVACYS